MKSIVNVLSQSLCFKLAFKVILIGLTVASLSAEPWGKDADLKYRKNKSTPCSSTECPTPFLGKFAEVMIGFHQSTISPADGPRSSYIPSSSQYTLDAMRKYGFYKGMMMGCDRLMRENAEEWVYRTIETSDGKTMKYDPVR